MSADITLHDPVGWLGAQRWFSSKDRPLTHARLVDHAPMGHDDGGDDGRRDGTTWMATLEASYEDGGTPDRWLLVLTPVAVGSEHAVGAVDGHPVGEIGTVPQAILPLLSAMTADSRVRSARGAVLAARHLDQPLDAEGPVRAMGVEQSNTSVVVGDPGSASQVSVKVIRRMEAGPNPDVELTEALARAGYAGTPALLGVITGPDDSALVVASQFVSGSRGAWEMAVTEASGQGGAVHPTRAVGNSIAAGMVTLGRQTAELHRVLASTLATETSSEADAIRMRQRILGDVRSTRQAVNQVPGGVQLRPRLRDDARQVVRATPSDLGVLQRIHGDFHLGQVIIDPDNGWWIIDFEGEPGRPMAERSRRDNPLRDVAGMLRSIAYAEAAAVRSGGDPDVAADWRQTAESGFLDGYELDGNDAGWLPAFLLDKLLYEARYEAANRPDWLPIPLAQLTRIGAIVPATPPAASQPPPPEDRAAPAAEPVAEPPTKAEGGGPDIVQEARDNAEALRNGRLSDPHRLLGRHPVDRGWVVRTWRPGASTVELVGVPDAPVATTQLVDGIFEAAVSTEPDPATYRWRITYGEEETFDLVDPYAFSPTLGEMDSHLLAEGRHEQAWTALGANRQTHHGISGVAFAVWAPNAHSVRVVGEFNSWDGRLHPMRSLGSSGIWELFVPDVAEGASYKFEMVTADGKLALRADPWAKWSEVPPGTSSRVFTSGHQWRVDPVSSPPDALHSPMSIYEVHLASWRHTDDGHGGRRSLSYSELAEQLPGYLTDMGFTHVEFLPVAEHPFGGSWGYQVTGQFAPTSRFGTPDDFRSLVDSLHESGIGVIVDWVPAHFPKDEWALARFDGTALYEHSDPRQGEHPDWGTLVFNYGRTEVRNFLLASALFWLEALGVDGLRVDAVASMLYLDYSRKAGEWVPNEHGGRENLRAVELLQEVNATAYKRNPGTLMIAEESTAWPGVSRPTHLGGLGFGFKWNMGWMHDTLAYFAREPVFRRWHHNQLTFGMMYAWSEHFVLPLSHDEVVHGKGSLLGKMPGDRWQQMANLRALYGWMWSHPGKKLLFMGGEIAQDQEWSEERELDWGVLDNPDHRGMQSMVRDLNTAYRNQPAMWRRDDDPSAFQWIDANNADDNLLAFLRYGAAGDPVVAVVANLSPVPRHDLRIGLPHAGEWDEVMNTDGEPYGGGNVGNLGQVTATDEPSHGLPASALISAPPLGVVWLASTPT